MPSHRARRRPTKTEPKGEDQGESGEGDVCECECEDNDTDVRVYLSGDDSEDDSEEDSPNGSADDSKYDSEDEIEAELRRQEEEDEPMWVYPVDLVTFEEEHGRTPIFTRNMLETIRKKKDVVLTRMRPPAADRKHRCVNYRAPGSRLDKIWTDVSTNDTDSIEVLYIDRVELDLDFQEEFGHLTEHYKFLRDYNNIAHSEVAYFDVPYAFNTMGCLSLNGRKSFRAPGAMGEYLDALLEAGQTWVNSQLCVQLTNMTHGAAAVSNPIRKIVCFGLGSLDIDAVFCEPAPQHLAVFTIAKTLGEVYQRADQPIEVLLQDPGYAEKDRAVMHDLHHQTLKGEEYPSTLRFVEDPDGLFAIHAHTLVISIFIPILFPMLHVVADLFAIPKGPAAFLCDGLAVDIDKRVCTLSDQESSAVARMLAPSYAQLHDAFQDERIEAAVDFGDRENGLFRYWHWLPRMDLWVRRKG